MSEKYLIFGATGSIGSSLAEQLKSSGNEIHLVGRNEDEVSSIAKKLNWKPKIKFYDGLDNYIKWFKSDYYNG